MNRLQVRNVISCVNDATTYEFSDGTQGTHQTVKDGRFLKAGPLDTLNAAQLLAVSNFNAIDNKKDGGWL